MSAIRPRWLSLTALIVLMSGGPARGQGTAASWLDQSRPASWNTPGRPIPAAPAVPGAVDPRCRQRARPPQSDEDRRVQAQGWDLTGAFQGGWQLIVINGTAGYDGMCRPRQYQAFVFRSGTFVGTLSPRPMDSRTEGALDRVSIESGRRLTAEYRRYAAADPLCCPSKRTSVVFDIDDPPRLIPVSTSTSAANATAAPQARPSTTPLAGTSWRLVRFQGGDDTTLRPDDRNKYTIEFVADGSLLARIDCNRGRGTWKATGSNGLQLGPLALTRAQCPPGSLHDQIVRQWEHVRSFVMKDGDLFLSLMADGGGYEFEPMRQANR